MKRINKIKALGAIGAVGVVGAAAGISLASCERIGVPTGIRIYGTDSILNGNINNTYTAQFSVVYDNGKEIGSEVAIEWRITTARPSGAELSITPEGVFTYRFTEAKVSTVGIECTVGNFKEQKEVTISIAEPTQPTSIAIFGPEELQGAKGITGSSKFSATYDNGGTFNSRWEIANEHPERIWIGEDSGVLEWDNEVPTSNDGYSLTIKCSSEGMDFEATKDVTLKILDEKPNPTSLQIYGAEALTGIRGIAESAQYSVSYDNGGSVDGATWSIKNSDDTDAEGIWFDNDILRWNNNLPMGNKSYVIYCSYNQFDVVQKNISLNIIENVPEPTSINLYGNNTLSGIIGVNGSSQYSVVLDNGRDIEGEAQWSLENKSDDANVNINKNGTLTWKIDSIQQSIEFTIVCNYQNFTAGIGVTLTISRPDLPRTSINTIYGAEELTGVRGIEGSAQYSASYDNGESVSGATWSVTSSPDYSNEIQINSDGELSWTNALVATNIQLTITCTDSQVGNKSRNVKLTIAEEKPTPTSLVMYGADELQGIKGIDGYAQYSVVYDNGSVAPQTGETAEWSVAGSSTGLAISDQGVLTWTNISTDQNITIQCTTKKGTDTVKSTSKAVTLKVENTYPKPTSVKVYGPETLQGLRGKAGYADYSAIYDNGQAIESSDIEWELTPKQLGISLGKNGHLIWDGSLINPTYSLNVTCTVSGFQAITKNVTLNINNVPHPTITLQSSGLLKEGNDEVKITPACSNGATVSDLTDIKIYSDDTLQTDVTNKFNVTRATDGSYYTITNKTAIPGTYYVNGVPGTGVTLVSCNFTVLAADPRMAIEAKEEGSLIINDSNSYCYISVTGLYGASDQIQKIDGMDGHLHWDEGATSRNVAKIKFNGTPLANETSYRLTVTNDEGRQTEVIILVRNTKENYVTFDDPDVKEYFDYAIDGVTGKYIVKGWKGENNTQKAGNDTEFNNKCSQKGYNGINFGANVIEISNANFGYSGTSFSQVSMGSSGRIKFLSFPNVKTISESAFLNCRGISKVYFGSQINTIHYAAFQQTGSTGGMLKWIVMDPNAVLESLGAGAFTNFSNLFKNEQIIISNENLGTIGRWYYEQNCSYIGKINDENKKVGILGGIAFGAIDLSHFDTLEEKAFEMATQIESFSNWVKDNKTNIPNTTFRHCRSIQEITIPNYVTSIGNSAFESCVKLEKVTFQSRGSNEESVSFGRICFQACDKLNLIQLNNLQYGSFYEDATTNLYDPFRSVGKTGQVKGNNQQQNELAAEIVKRINANTAGSDIWNWTYKPN